MTCIPALSERSRCFGWPKSRDEPRVTTNVDRLFYVHILNPDFTNRCRRSMSPPENIIPTRTAVYRLPKNRVIISDQQIEDKFKSVQNRLLQSRIPPPYLAHIPPSHLTESFHPDPACKCFNSSKIFFP